MRQTEDNIWVTESEMVWEIMYRYFNGEVSRAEPEARSAKEIPFKYKIWKHRGNCQAQCFLNNNVDK